MNGCNNQIKLFRLVFETRPLFNTHSRPQLEAENNVKFDDIASKFQKD